MVLSQSTQVHYEAVLRQKALKHAHGIVKSLNNLFVIHVCTDCVTTQVNQRLTNEKYEKQPDAYLHGLHGFLQCDPLSLTG